METESLIEEWRDVVGFEGLYQVSNLGRVKGLDRLVDTNINNVNRRIHKGKLLKHLDNLPFGRYNYYMIIATLARSVFDGKRKYKAGNN